MSNSNKERSLKQKITLAFSGLVAATVILICAIFLFQLIRLRDAFSGATATAAKSISDISSTTMQQQSQEALLERARINSDLADNIFKSFGDSISMTADYVTNLYDNSGQYPSRAIPLPDKENKDILAVQLLFSASTDQNSEAITSEVGLLSNAQDLLMSINQSTEEMASNYIATKSGIMIQADSISNTKFDDDGNILPYEAATRPWYRGAMENDEMFFTSVTRDIHTGRYGIMCGVPFYRGDEFMGVAGGGIYLDSLEDIVRQATNLSEGEFACIINADGQVVFSPREYGVFEVDADNPQDLRQSDDEKLSELVTQAIEGQSGISHLSVDGGGYYIAFAPMSTAGWSFFTVMPESKVLQYTDSLLDALGRTTEDTVKQTSQFFTQMIIILLIVIVLLGALVMWASYKLSSFLVQPIQTLTERVTAVNGDNLNFEWEYDTGDEVQKLATSFGLMTGRMKEYIKEITEVTAEKERIGAELNVATEIQADMLPRIFPPYPDRSEFDLFATMNPAKEVGGDFYDFFLVDDDHLALVMADVSGKGVPAALFMVIAKTMIKNRAQMGGSPAEILAYVNDQLCEGNDAMLFVTVWLGILTLSTGELEAASAGHEYPAIYKSGEGFALDKTRHGPPLATMEGLHYKNLHMQLNKGDAIYLYTDGVTEATNKDNVLFGEERMLDALNKYANEKSIEITAAVRREIDAFVGDAPQFDDITMLCLKYAGAE